MVTEYSEVIAQVLSVGLSELVPLMGAARQPAQHVFGADDGERKALPVTVQCRDHHHAARLDHRRTAGQERAARVPPRPATRA